MNCRDFYPNGDPKATQGNKKVTLTNTPLTMLPLIAAAINDGAAKYGKYNWLTQADESMDIMVYLNGIMRHLLLFMAGQDYTSDSNAHHLAAIQAGAAVLMDALFFDKVKDTRIKLDDEQLKKYEKLINNELK